MSKRFNISVLERLVRLYSQDVSIYNISRMLDMHRHTVHSWLKYFDILNPHKTYMKTDSYKQNMNRARTGKDLGHHRRHSEETKIKISIANGGRPAHNSKGRIRYYRIKIQSSRVYRLWRKSVFERDKYTCLICGKVGGQINAHHIASFKDYPLLRFDVNNGVTLCVDCHYITHRKKEGKHYANKISDIMRHIAM